MSRRPPKLPEEAPAALPRRLCSEIKLFDLCELERCRYKDGTFCTDPELLSRFEAQADPEDRPKWHFDRDADGEDDEAYPDAFEDGDDDDYSVFDAEDDEEQDEQW